MGFQQEAVIVRGGQLILKLTEGFEDVDQITLLCRDRADGVLQPRAELFRTHLTRDRLGCCDELRCRWRRLAIEKLAVRIGLVWLDQPMFEQRSSPFSSKPVHEACGWQSLAAMETPAPETMMARPWAIVSWRSAFGLLGRLMSKTRNERQQVSIRLAAKANGGDFPTSIESPANGKVGVVERRTSCMAKLEATGVTHPSLRQGPHRHTQNSITLHERQRRDVRQPRSQRALASQAWVTRQRDAARTHDKPVPMSAQKRSPEALLAGEAGRTALLQAQGPASRWVRAMFACGISQQAQTREATDEALEFSLQAAGARCQQARPSPQAEA